MRTLLAAFIAAFFVSACAAVAPSYDRMRETTIALEFNGIVRGGGVVVVDALVVTARPARSGEHADEAARPAPQTCGVESAELAASAGLNSG